MRFCPKMELLLSCIRDHCEANATLPLFTFFANKGREGSWQSEVVQSAGDELFCLKE